MTCVKRSTFLNVFSTLTALDSNIKSSIDYVVGCYVNEIIEDLIRIVRRFWAVGDRERYNKQIECVACLFKSIFLESDIHRNELGLQSKQFTLLLKRDLDDRITVDCLGCRAPFGLLNSMKPIIPEERNDALCALRNNRQRLFLYYVHLHRVFAQQRAIETVLEEIVTQKLHHHMVLLAD